MGGSGVVEAVSVRFRKKDAGRKSILTYGH